LDLNFNLPVVLFTLPTTTIHQLPPFSRRVISSWFSLI